MPDAQVCCVHLGDTVVLDRRRGDVRTAESDERSPLGVRLVVQRSLGDAELDGMEEKASS